MLSDFSEVTICSQLLYNYGNSDNLKGSVFLLSNKMLSHFDWFLLMIN